MALRGTAAPGAAAGALAAPIFGLGSGLVGVAVGLAVGGYLRLGANGRPGGRAGPKEARGAAAVARSGPVPSGLHALDAKKANLNKSTKRRIKNEALEARVYTVVMTGGPCGGKSSSLEHLTDRLKARGFDVYSAPEVPTILMNGGCVYPGADGGRELLEFETGLVALQIQMEDSFKQIARSTGRPSIVVFDRALLDVAAYLPEPQWREILEHNKLEERGLLARYDLVMHLVTAADGAEEFYTTANNAARTETAAEARALDRRVAGCWKDHPNLRRVPNDGDFGHKLEAATDAVIDLVSGGAGPGAGGGP